MFTYTQTYTYAYTQTHTNTHMQSIPFSLSQIGPAASTGKGSNVEHVYSIMESIIQLSESSTTFQTNDQIMSMMSKSNSYKQEDIDDMKMDFDTDMNMDIVPIKRENGSSKDAIKKQQRLQLQKQLHNQQQQQQQQIYDYLETDSNLEQSFIKHLSDATTSFSKRITNFQRLLLNLIQHYLCQYKKNNKLKKSNVKTMEQNKAYVNELLDVGELKKQISVLQNNCSVLKGKVVDLAKDRDVAKDSERKVRRGLYRVASGRMKITEVLKVRPRDK